LCEEKRTRKGAGNVTKYGKALLVKKREICGEEILVPVQNTSVLPSVIIKRMLGLELPGLGLGFYGSLGLEV